jgi:Ca2+-binding EF-hand superfamily protein
MFDQDNKGFITEADLREKFHEKKIYADPSAIIQRFDRDGDGNLSFQEFKHMVTPLNRRYQAGEEYLGGRLSRSSSPCSLRSREPVPPVANSKFTKYQHLTWVEDLKEILFTISNADDLI